MAENEDGQEKTEDPSEKRLRESREKGQVPRSKELGTLLMMLISALWLLWLGAGMIESFEVMLKGGLTLDRDHAFDMKKAGELIFAQVEAGLWLIIPFLLAMGVVAVIANILVGGWNFSTQVWVPKFDKLDPIKGIGRMVSMNALVELVKALLKFLMLTVVAVLFVYSVLHELMLLGREASEPGLAHAGTLLVQAFLVMTLGLIVIALIDAPYQLWHHNEQMKMTQQEVKEEFKQTEGNPEIKGRIRRMQREMAMRRMMQDVPKADVIITNPEHYAVALQYDMDSMREPLVLATGIDFNAAQIRTIAQQHDIPIVRSPALARALYYNAEAGRPIPVSLFAAVAQVLSYVFQLKEKRIASLPDLTRVAVPAELKQSPDGAQTTETPPS